MFTSKFFLLRTPLLPIEEFLDWSSNLESPAVHSGELDRALQRDRIKLVDGLRDVSNRPEIQEALFVASPQLHDRVMGWLENPRIPRAAKVEQSLVRYFVRMCTRPTPFGLFSGITSGRIGLNPQLRISARSKYQRRTRLDMNLVHSIVEMVEADHRVRESLLYRPNSSLYEVPGAWHYVESRMREGYRAHELVRVEDTEHLRSTLRRAREGVSPSALVDALVSEEVSTLEARAYLNELIDSQLLVSDLGPSVTQDDPLTQLISRLERVPIAQELGISLKEIHMRLRRVDSFGLGCEVEEYKTVVKNLERLLDATQDPNAYQFHVDMFKPSGDLVLGRAQVEEVKRGTEVLQQLAVTRSRGALARFAEDFVERYGDREVPLLKALDNEMGLGFGESGATAPIPSAILDGLRLPIQSNPVEWSPTHSFLVDKLVTTLQLGEDELTVDPSELPAAENPSWELPDAFHVLATLVAESESRVTTGDYRILIHHAMGPSGTRLLGRFCYGDPTLKTAVKDHMAAEEALNPEAIFAEVVHLPEGRVGNILLRPVLRQYEIPYLGRSSVAQQDQISVDDLRVSVSDGRVILRSSRLNRQILPRVCSAHNYSRGSLPVYQFLCSLQEQHLASRVMWSWGPLEAAPFLPRVTAGRSILSRARWAVTNRELQFMFQYFGGHRLELLRKWRSTRRIPRFIILAEGDNELLLDLENVLSIETFAHLIRKRRSVNLYESIGFPNGLCISGPEGRFSHELVIPFVRSNDVRPAHHAINLKASPPQDSVPAPPIAQTFPPGSEWVFAKLYTGRATADRILTELIAPFVTSSLSQRQVWFFIRYGDPRWHLRLRIEGDLEASEQTLARLLDLTKPLIEREQVWRVELDTYEREFARYGGPDALVISEKIFQADSEATLSILSSLSDDTALRARSRVALASINLLMSDLGLNIEEKRLVARLNRDAFRKEFDADSQLLGQISRRYRQEKDVLERLIDNRAADEIPNEGWLALRHRSASIAPLAVQIRRLSEKNVLSRSLLQITRSLVHMNINRLMPGRHRAHEFLFSEYLDRLYTSQLEQNENVC